MSKALNITLPKPHAKQRIIEASTKKRIGINAGRQAGKTFMVARKAIYQANAGQRVLYVAPVADQTDAFWELCSEWLEDTLSTGIVKKNETKRKLDFILAGGRIQARTGNKPNHLRGGYGDFIILDEFAYQKEIIWTKVCQPMLLKNDGAAMFISTPDLRNHFYHMYLKAQDRKDWDWFTFTSLDNPHLSKRALERLTADMTDIDYRQEILAEFVPGVGAVFTVSPEDFYTPPKEPAIVHDGHRFVAGLDWGQKVDYTALSIGCATCQKELGIWRLKEVDYQLQRDFIKELIADYKDIELLAESNSIGQPNIEALWQDGIEVMPFNTSSTSKAGIIQGMRLAFNQREWKWVNDQPAWLELEAFEMKLTRTGLPQYAAPDGINDDTVISRALMLHQALKGTMQVY